MSPLLQIAIDVARAAGEETLRYFGESSFTPKGDGSPVTAADMGSHDVLSARLKGTGIPILSEEDIRIVVPYPSPLWIIDPLDGTKDFIAGSKDFSVMVGLIEHSKPVIGVVYAPAHDILYYAENGSGSFIEKNGEAARLRVPESLHSPLRFICSVNHFSPQMEEVAQALGAEKIPRGSIGIKAGLIAEGKGDFTFNLGKLGEWDVCAPEVILTEAGGVVTDRFGNALVYGNEGHRIKHGAVLSNHACHGAVLRTVQEQDAVE
jgi:3'(2'), 5'-bisphosphate nucleotidase